MNAREARLQSLADGVIRLGPRVVHFDVTNACNARCVSCWDHSPLLNEARPATWKRQYVNAGFVADVLDDIVGLGGLEDVILSGMGEPFVHPQIGAIITAVKQRGLTLTMITNLLPADPDRVLEWGVDQLLVGIHAASAQTYATFHPGFGNRDWHALNSALARFAQAGRHFKHVHTICAVNAHELTGMIALGARHRAAQVNFKLASLGRGTERVRITDQQRTWLLERGITAAEAEAERSGVKHNLAVLRAQLEAGGAATARIEDVGCWLGYDYARITVDGTALFCCNTEMVVGSLHGPGDFARLWRGPRWQALRARSAQGELRPSCSQCGKLNENIKLGERFRARFGCDRWSEVPEPHTEAQE